MGVALRLLWDAPVDYDNEADEAAYYTIAARCVSIVIATPASDLDGLRIKAQAVAWCCASHTDFALGDSSCARVIGSLLRDLLTT